MKNFSLLFIAFVFSTSHSFGQAKIKVEYEGVIINNTQEPLDNSAILDISADNKGILFPRLTTEQRDQIPAPARGLFIYNLTEDNYEFFNGNLWMGMALIPGGTSGGGTIPPDPSLIANGYEGTLASGVATAFVSSNSEWVSIPEWTMSGDFTIAFNYLGGNGPITGHQPVALEGHITIPFALSSMVQIGLGGSTITFNLLQNLAVGDHVLIVRDGFNAKCYVNRVLQETEPVSTVDWKQNTIGRLTDTYSNITVNELKVFDDKLNQSQIDDLYNNPQQTKPTSITANLERYYKLSETNTTDGGIIFDYSDNAAHGTFHTTASQPSNASVTGIIEGYQTALGNFNRYYHLDGNDDIFDLDNAITISGDFVIEVTGIFLQNSANNQHRIFGSQDNTSRFDVKNSLVVVEIDNITYNFNSSGINYGEKEVITLTRAADQLTVETNETSETLTVITSDFVIDHIADGLNTREVTGIIAQINFDGDVRTPFDNWGGSNVSGSPNKINIYGQDHNSTIDIFGNSFQYEWKEGMFNFAGGNHGGINAGTNVDLTSDFTLITFAKVIVDDPLFNHFVSNRLYGAGITWFVRQTDGKQFIHIDDGPQQILVFGDGPHTLGEWVCYAVTVKTDGTTNFYYGENAVALAQDGTADQATLALASTAEKYLEIAGNPATVFEPNTAQRSQTFIVPSILPLADIENVRQYVFDNIINP